jgi:hypothetical protein
LIRGARPPPSLTRIKPNFSNSLIARLLLLRDNPVTCAESTISLPHCSDRNASNRITIASLRVFVLFDLSSRSRHAVGIRAHLASKVRCRFSLDLVLDLDLPLVAVR